MRKLTALLIALAQVPVPGALTFSGATSNRVDCGSASSLDDLTAFTALMWVYPTTLTDDRSLITKYRGSVAEGWQFAISGTGGDVALFQNRATTSLHYITNSTPLATNSWRFLSVTYTRTGPAVNVYSGTRDAASTAATFGTSTGGAGTFSLDTSRSLMLGNRDAASPNASFQGRISVVMLVNRGMPAGEVATWQFRPRLVPGTIGFWILNGTGTQGDLSGNGNNCTVTGATQSDHSPLGPYFGFDWRNQTLRILGVYGD